MAKVSKIAKSKRTPKYAVQHRNRCAICGRPRAYICFRKMALEGLLPGVRKSSW
jgi:small subunit ribosomal protein S14